jgi:WD40 repeat protein
LHHPLLKHQGTVNCAAFSPDGHWVVTGDQHNMVRVWDISRMQRASAPVAPLPGQPAQRVPAATPGRWLSPDGRRVVTSERSHGARLRDAATGQPLGPLLRHGGTVLHAAFSPDSRRVVTTSNDNSARVWDTETGELLGQPMRHTGTVRIAAFSPDGELVVTGAATRAVREWEVSTGQPITPALHFDEVIQQALYEDGGEVARLTGTGGTVWTLDLHSDPRPAADLASLAWVLSGIRIDSDRGIFPLAADELRRTWERMRERYPEEFTP